MKLMPKVYTEIDFNSTEASERAVQIMRGKRCLNDIYVETYQFMMKLKKELLWDNGEILEIGSGGGFLKDIFPEVITSDVKNIKTIDLLVNAEKLPFKDHSFSAIFAVHVIHHISDITSFLKEATRVLKPGGGIICAEPYWSPVARFVYSTMHPEPFNPQAEKWQLDGSSPMTSSNQAMTYLLLKRDKQDFQHMFPEYKLVYQKRFGFIRYIMTGGIWLDQKLPDFMFPVLKLLEIFLNPIMPLLALHHVFVWKKVQ